MRRFPNIEIYAQKAKWEQNPDNPNEYFRKRVDDEIKQPLFYAQMKPDILAVGFDLGLSEARGDPDPTIANPSPGWYFSLRERKTNVRFGMDVPPVTERDPLPSVWQKLDWKHIADLESLSDYKDVNFIDSLLQLSAQGEKDVYENPFNSANIAFALFQKPVDVAIHADEML